MGKMWKLELACLGAALAVACQRLAPTPIWWETAGPRAPAPTIPVTVPSLTPRPMPTPVPRAALGVSCAAPFIPVMRHSPLGAAEECLHLRLNAGEERAFDGYAIAAMIGRAERPACAAFGLALSWKVTAGDGEGIVWTVNAQGVKQVWKGPEGIRFVGGCASFTLRNDGAGPVDVDVRVAVVPRP
jgi:hypothetical protein